MGINSEFNGIPTREEFRKYSTPDHIFANWVRDNDLLKEMDQALKEYHAAVVKRSISYKHVLRIALSCVAWLESKKQVQKVAIWPVVKRLLNNSIEVLPDCLDNMGGFSVTLKELLKEDRFEEMDTLLKAMNEQAKNAVLHPDVQLLIKSSYDRRWENTLVTTKRFCLDCIKALNMESLRPKDLRIYVENMLANGVLRLFGAFNRRDMPVFDPQKGFNLAKLKEKITVLPVIYSPPKPSEIKGLKPVWVKAFQELENRLGDYRRGKSLEPGMWGETLGVGPKGGTHFYGGGVGLDAMAKHTGMQFKVDPSYHGKPWLEFDPREYKKRAEELLKLGDVDRGKLKWGVQQIKVRYFDNDDRHRHQLHKQGTLFGKMVPDPKGGGKGGETWKAYTTSAVRPELYAMDTEGNIFAIADAELKEYDAVARHSTLLGGRAVLCAGCLDILGGRLCVIDNDSGHYKPNTNDLIKLLSKLKHSYKVDLSTVLVMDAAQSIHNYFYADLFASRFGTVSDNDVVPGVEKREDAREIAYKTKGKL